uniref:Non-SMC condensin II complex, subunit D3 n=1 Tax=Mastacembelus armatus TaxID=205130 RepID=A0A7N8WQ28_9TELE
MFSRVIFVLILNGEDLTPSDILDLSLPWVEAVWDLEFTERRPLDDTIQQELIVNWEKAFRNLYQCLLVHGSVWAILKENGTTVKSLVAVLSLFVLAGKSKAASVQQKVSGLHAASVYLLLLGIPGSIANKVFHEVLFDTCSNLTSHCWPQDSGKKRKKHNFKSSQTEGKRFKPQRKDTPEAEEEKEEEELNFSGQDLMSIRDAVVLLVQSLLRLLHTFPIKDRQQSSSNCAQVTTDSIIMLTSYEFRSHGAQAVGMLTSQMEGRDYAYFIKWLFNFSRHSKMVRRLFSVDVVMVLLEQPERRPEECQDPELACFLPHKFLIQSMLFARQMDESPSVQGHALACLAQCLELSSLNMIFIKCICKHWLHVFVCVDLSSISFDIDLMKYTQLFVFIAAKENLALLLQHLKDSKTNVRKSALQALVGLLKHNVIPMSLENLARLSERCRDPAVSVKKKALQCVGELLTAKPECRVMQKAWLQGVVPAVVDSESSVQDKALEALDQVLLSQVKLCSDSCCLDSSQRLTWDLLGLLCHDCHNLSHYFSRAVTMWSKQKKFTPLFITNLISHTEADHAAGAWLLLSKVVSSSIRLPYAKILNEISVTTCCHILCVMGDIAEHLNKDTKYRIIDDLMSLLKTFTLSLEVISAAVETIYQLGRSDDVRQTQVKHLHTLGVASLYCPAKVSKRTVLLVESILTTHSDKLAECPEQLPALLPPLQFSALSLPARVRAHGVITLAKLCLQHEDLVQKYLPVFARELEVGTQVAVRNNVVVIMCDLCVRYTNIVDHYIPNISACLRDSEAVIREQTLIMLTNLLQEEFVKWKGSLFFRFVVALVDPDPAIASLCEYCLLHLLLKKNPEMFSQHFIECIFHFNSYSKHKSYNKFPQSEREKVQFSLKGAQHSEKRFLIYRFLLKYITDAQRIILTHKINQTVLACFADEELPLDADGAEILSETFNILSLKEMKLQVTCTPAGGAAGEEPEEENMHTMAKAVLQAAQKKVVSQVQKKTFIENTVPLIISLKSLLEQKHSPVLRDLMAYLQVTMQDYRNEVKEFFSEDKHLAAEVEFALKMTEKEAMKEQMHNCQDTVYNVTKCWYPSTVPLKQKNPISLKDIECDIKICMQSLFTYKYS